MRSISPVEDAKECMPHLLQASRFRSEVVSRVLCIALDALLFDKDNKAFHSSLFLSPSHLYRSSTSISVHHAASRRWILVHQSESGRPIIILIFQHRSDHAIFGQQPLILSVSDKGYFQRGSLFVFRSHGFSRSNSQRAYLRGSAFVERSSPLFTDRKTFSRDGKSFSCLFRLFLALFGSLLILQSETSREAKFLLLLLEYSRPILYDLCLYNFLSLALVLRIPRFLYSLVSSSAFQYSCSLLGAF